MIPHDSSWFIITSSRILFWDKAISSKFQKVQVSWFWCSFCWGPRAFLFWMGYWEQGVQQDEFCSTRHRILRFGWYMLVLPFWPNMCFSRPTGTSKSWQIGSWIDWNHALSLLFDGFHPVFEYHILHYQYIRSNLFWLMMFVSQIILAPFLFKTPGFWQRHQKCGIQMVLSPIKFPSHSQIPIRILYKWYTYIHQISPETKKKTSSCTVQLRRVKTEAFAVLSLDPLLPLQHHARGRGHWESQPRGTLGELLAVWSRRWRL